MSWFRRGRKQSSGEQSHQRILYHIDKSSGGQGRERSDYHLDKATDEMDARLVDVGVARLALLPGVGDQKMGLLEPLLPNERVLDNVSAEIVDYHVNYALDVSRIETQPVILYRTNLRWIWVPYDGSGEYRPESVEVAERRAGYFQLGDYHFAFAAGLPEPWTLMALAAREGSTLKTGGSFAGLPWALAEPLGSAFGLVTRVLLGRRAEDMPATADNFVLIGFPTVTPKVEEFCLSLADSAFPVD